MANVTPHLGIEVGFAGMALGGHPETGDRHVVTPTTTGHVIAVIDGLGHGADAARSADIAVRSLSNNAERPLAAQILECHACLRQERGVVLAIASTSIEQGLLQWIGVGNIQGLLLRSDLAVPVDHLLVRGGIVGSTLPALREETVPVRPGDTLVMSTDGIRPDYGRALNRHLSPQQLADSILNEFCKGDDDSLVLVVRFVPRSGNDKQID